MFRGTGRYTSPGSPPFSLQNIALFLSKWRLDHFDNLHMHVDRVQRLRVGVSTCGTNGLEFLFTFDVGRNAQNCPSNVYDRTPARPPRCIHVWKQRWYVWIVNGPRKWLQLHNHSVHHVGQGTVHFLGRWIPDRKATDEHGLKSWSMVWQNMTGTVSARWNWAGTGSECIWNMGTTKLSLNPCSKASRQN